MRLPLVVFVVVSVLLLISSCNKASYDYYLVRLSEGIHDSTPEIDRAEKAITAVWGE